MTSLLVGFGYGEFIWYIFKTGKVSLPLIKGHCWFMVILNFTLAMFIGSMPNLEISIIVLFYTLVIYNLRTSKNGQPKT